jgi:threonine/homoserine/homoserine lactone efflux protein
MNTLNPKFWAVFGFVVGFLIALGGADVSVIDGLVGGLLQMAIWFGISTLFIKGRKAKAETKENETQKLSMVRKIVGGFFFFGGVLLLIGASWGADGAAFAPALFNLAIGIPMMWPVLKVWLNRIPFTKSS